MATKKQKREAALAKRAAFMAEERERGLRAQAAFKEQEAYELQLIAEAISGINDYHRSILERHGIHE